MDLAIVSLLVAGILCAWAWARERTSRRPFPSLEHLPPGPRPWPVVGNMLQLGLGGAPHKTFADLALVHGPLFTLRLGSVTTVVVSSPAIAQEMFKSHDAPLSGRMMYEAMNLSRGNSGSIITAQPGTRWRMLRRICATRLFSAARVDALEGIRAACIGALSRRIEADAGEGRSTDLGRLMFLVALDHMGRLLLSMDIMGSSSDIAAEFFYHVGCIMELVGKPNMADFFPAIKSLDPQRIRSRMQVHVNHALHIVSRFVNKRTQTLDQGLDEDLLSVLLNYEGNNDTDELARLSSEIINVMIFEMFIAGSDTSASTMEWAMAELLRHPKAMHIVQAELRRTFLGKPVVEKEVMNLPYLNAVIKETLRLHPPLPLLVPHKALQPCKLLGYNIPLGTQVFVNVWGIGRDPKFWEQPDAFIPERFLDPAAPDYKGQSFHYIPFGSGRRMCPGMPLVSRLLPLVLGTMLNSFDWSLPGAIKAEEMDMRERMGMALRKAVPLTAIATPFKFCM